MASTQKERSEKCYKRRRENGLCPVCGKKVDRDGYYCAECLAKQREYRKRNRDFYRKEKICTVCGKERVYGEDRICFECRVKINSRRKPLTDSQKEKMRENAKNTYKDRIDSGICTRCGKRKTIVGRRKCGICLEKDAEMHRRKNIDKKNIKEYRKENGLCYYCGDIIDAEVGKLCRKCLEICRENGLKSKRGNHYWKQDNKLVFRS